MCSTSSPTECARLVSIAPQFLVRDLRISLAYYEEWLGFEQVTDCERFYARETTRSI